VQPIYYQVLPLAAMPGFTAAERAADWYLAQPADRLIAFDPAIHFHADQPPKLDPRWLADPPPSTVLIYDPMYARYNADAGLLTTPEALAAAGWVSVNIAELNLPDGWMIYRSPG
jgi:hypothetical protein